MKKKAISIILAAMMAVTPMSVSAQDVFTSESTLAVETSAELEAGTSSGEKKYQGFTYKEENGAIVITGYSGNAKDIKIPESINGKKVLYVRGMNAFSSPKIRSVSMPSVVEVGTLTFSGCNNLASVYMPKVRSIGLSAFSGSELTSVKLPAVETISMAAFSNCTKLSNVSMPRVRIIARDAFMGCTNLKNVSIPYTISKIQFRAFANCGLTSIKLQDLYGDVSIERTALGYKIGANDSETKINGFKIYGNTGTSVEKYARENGFEFISSKPKAERFTLKLASETIDYTGKAVKPKITVTYKGKKVAAKNYTVKYSNNKETGTATILVTGKGSYKNCTGYTTFEIIPKPVENWSCSSNKKGTVTVTWKYNKPASSYSIEFSTKADFSDVIPEQVYDPDKTTCTKENLQSGKKYYVRMNVCDMNGRTSRMSKTKTVVVK